MIGLMFGQQDGELLPDGLDDVWWQRGHEAYSFVGKRRELPR
jgi:hypothetical protein